MRAVAIPRGTTRAVAIPCGTTRAQSWRGDRREGADGSSRDNGGFAWEGDGSDSMLEDDSRGA